MQNTVKAVSLMYLLIKKIIINCSFWDNLHAALRHETKGYHVLLTRLPLENNNMKSQSRY